MMSIPTKPKMFMSKHGVNGLSCTPRYIPVQGQKQYCDLIRKLSGADSKDAKVEKLDKISHFFVVSALSHLIRFAQVPDYLEATIYDKESAVIMVRPDQTYSIALSYTIIFRWET